MHKFHLGNIIQYILLIIFCSNWNKHCRTWENKQREITTNHLDWLEMNFRRIGCWFPLGDVLPTQWQRSISLCFFILLNFLLIFFKMIYDTFSYSISLMTNYLLINFTCNVVQYHLQIFQLQLVPLQSLVFFTLVQHSSFLSHPVLSLSHNIYLQVFPLNHRCCPCILLSIAFKTHSAIALKRSLVRSSFESLRQPLPLFPPGVFAVWQTFWIPVVQ